MPDRPWQKLSLDYQGPTPDGTDLLIIHDNYSRFIVEKEVKSKCYTVVVSILHTVWATFGIPRLIKSDNGRTFISKDFESMCELFGIKHILITPIDRVQMVNASASCKT
jgi:transposase InsO family protein